MIANNQLPETDTRSAEPVRAKISKGLGSWLKAQNLCLLISSYQSGRLIIVGANDKAEPVVNLERFDRAMGIAVQKDRILLATLRQILLFRLSRRLAREKTADSQLIVPQVTFHTGFVNCHDVAWAGEVPIFASSMFNCIGMINAESSFVPVWIPPFLICNSVFWRKWKTTLEE
jgi:uncharacterized protein (TIGR03032 family)